MLTQYNATDIEMILRDENPPPLFPPASDRGAWNTVRESIGEEAVAHLMQRAEDAASSEIPLMSATPYTLSPCGE